MDTSALINDLASEKLEVLKHEGLYRKFVAIAHSPERFPVGICQNTGREIIDFSTSDYLGLSVNPVVCEAAIAGVKASGVGSGGSHNLGGRYPELGELEQLLALQHGKGAALLFNSGYSTNFGLIRGLTRLFGENKPVYFSDQWNHRSIIEPILDQQKRVFKHNDMADLERLLEEASRTHPNSPKVIVFEGLYSMDGSIPDIRAMSVLAKKYGAILISDEVHAVGMYGENGCGICEEQGVLDDVDIVVGGFGKAHGSTGGYAVGDAKLIDYIRSFCPEFIFTATANHPTISASLAATKYLMTKPPERQAHAENVIRLKELFIENEVPALDMGGHIIPVMIGDAETAKSISTALLEKHGILVRAAFFPSVPHGEARLRIVPNAKHTEQHLEKLASSIREVMQEHGLLNDTGQIKSIDALKTLGRRNLPRVV